MTCLEDNSLVELASGRMSPAQLEDAEAHLDGCARCRRALALMLRSGGEPVARPAPLVGPGTAIGRYLVVERVGVGAMGQVFSAYDPQLDRKVAIKLLRPGSATPEQRARLAREAQTLARMSHPNVVTVFDVGTWEGQLFIALEFVSSGSAREWAKQTRDWRDTVALYLQAGRGLAAAHDAGVVHRDFKADNILVRPDGRAQVTDFGLAAGVYSSAPSAPKTELDLTHSGVLLGTPAYMAPDQLEGAPATQSSDQYSFCASLFEALYATRPFSGTDLAELSLHAREGKLAAVPQGNATPQSVRKILARGLSPHPAARYPSLGALLDALESETSRSRRLGVAALGTVALGLLVVAGLQWTAQVRRHPSCVLAEERQAETWNPARQEKARAAFLATQLPYAKNAWGFVEQAISPRVSAWTKLRAEACEAVVGADPDPIFRAQLLCLDERWGEIDATLGVLELGGPESVNRALQVIDKLPAIGVCGQASVLQQKSASDGGTCEACVRDAAEVARVRALVESGRFVQAEQAGRADGGLTTAAAQAAMQLEHARALEELGKIDDAEHDFFEVALAGLRVGDDALGAAAWVELAHLVGYLRGKPAEGEKWAAQAEALHGDTLLAERLAAVRGVIAARRGEHAKAEEYFAITEQLTRQRLGPNHPSSARALSNLGSAQQHQGRFDEGLPKLARAAALIAAALGEEHPDTLRALNSWGAALGEQQRFEEAAPVFERVLAGYKKTLGDDNQRIGIAALNLAEARFRLNDFDAALSHFEQAAKVWTHALGPDAPDLAAALGGMGEVRLAQKLPVLALEPLRRGLAICEKAECEPVDEASIRFMVAQASIATKQPRAAATVQARKALALFKTAGEKQHADEVEAWLKAN